MFKTWRIGRLMGFPIEVSLSFLILLGLVFVGFIGVGGLLGLAVVALTFSSVLLHELGHAVVARQLGVHVGSIELNFFGGAAKMHDLPRSANHEIAIAAAGPVVSLALAGLGFGLGAVTASSVVLLIGWINLVIAAFNLIPALPMDGGRILRALLSRSYDYVRATDMAVKVSSVTAVAFVIAGLALGSIQLIFLGPLLWVISQRERVLARMAGRQAPQYATHREPRYVMRMVNGRMVIVPE